jgi:hypothetical protein
MSEIIERQYAIKDCTLFKAGARLNNIQEFSQYPEREYNLSPKDKDRDDP